MKKVSPSTADNNKSARTAKRQPTVKAGKKSPDKLEKTSIENDILLSLNSDIATIRDKKDILSIINPKIKKLFNTDDIFICRLDPVGKTLNPLLRVGARQRYQHPDFEKTINQNFPIHDGFIDTILASKTPLIFDIDEVTAWPHAPAYMKILQATGITESLSVALYHAGELIGILSLWAEKKNTFNGHHINLVQKITDHISIIISNISADEAIKKRDRQNEILLSVSNQIASIREQEDLLHIIRTSIKEHIDFDDSYILQYNKESKTCRVFMYHANERRKNNPAFAQQLRLDYPLDDDISDPHLPFVFDVEEMAKSEAMLSFLKETGIKEMVGIKLMHSNQLTGLWVLLSERRQSFKEEELYLLQRLSYQISVATANIIANGEIEKREAEKSLLLSLSNDMALVRSKEDLASIINQKLKKLFSIADFTIVALHESRMTYGAYLYDEKDTPYKKKREYVETLFNKFRFEDGLYDVVLQSDEPVVFNIGEMMTRDIVPGHISFFHSLGIKEIVGAALRIGKDNIGILWIQPEKEHNFDAVNKNIFKGVSSQISIALANILSNEEIQRREEEKAILLALSNNIGSTRNRTDLLHVITRQLKKLFRYNDASIIILDKTKQTYRAFVLDMEERRTSHKDCLVNASGEYPVADGICDTILAAGKPIILNYAEVLKSPAPPSWAVFLHHTGIKEMICVALSDGTEQIGAFFLHSESENYFHEYQLNLFQGIGYQLSVALANVLANEKIAAQLQQIDHYKSQLEEENQYLQQQIGTTNTYTEMIGSSQEIQKVFHLLNQVSFTDTTVLILGETGTGKELIARAIHNASQRKGKLMVKVNCASLPANLIESELFGHEKGAFTGAIVQKIGKFELANHGTLFLDEIGEMPLDLQVKLLRAIQEKEIERVGGKSTIKTDVRIIAATNRDLQKEVDEGRFRSDLFYRLNVFPITLPALRSRKEDIPALTAHFIEKYARNAGKNIKSISQKVMMELMAYSWPGNVRELEHLVERSILLTNGSIIKEMHLPSMERKELKKTLQDTYIKTIEENERDHILAVLNTCNGKIYGQGGAASLLGVPVSTLNSKMKKLGIKKEHVFVSGKQKA